MKPISLRFKKTGGILSVVGTLKMKYRTQHPNVLDDGLSWFIRVRVPSADRNGQVKEVYKRYKLGRSKGEGAIGKREAERERDKILIQTNRLQETPASTEAKTMRLGDLWVTFTESHLSTTGIANRVQYEGNYRRYIAPHFALRRMEEIKTFDIQEWLNKCHLSWNSRQSMKRSLAKFFEWSMDQYDYPLKNPCRKVSVGKKALRFSLEILEPEQIMRVIERLSHRWQLIVKLALINGLRISEALGLRWSSVNLSTGRIRIRERVWRGDVGMVKTAGSERNATLGSLVTEFQALDAERAEPKDNRQFVFRSADGVSPVRDDTVRKALKTAAQAEGVDFLGFGFHTLRRANITWRQSDGGATHIEASKMAGHTGVNMTAHYTKIQDKRMEETTARIEDMLAAATTGPRLVEKGKRARG